MKLSFFPSMYPDEDFRSIIYRYHILSGNTDFAVTNREIFGKGSYRNTIFPRNLNSLLKQFPNNALSAEVILLNHTFYYWVKPFIPEERLPKVLDEIMNNKGNSNLGSLLGSGEERFISENPRYCPTCMRNDENKYGEVYLHRIHQLAFLSCCPFHGDELLSQCPICEQKLVDSESGKLLATLNLTCGHSLIDNRKNICSIRKQSGSKIFWNFVYFILHPKSISRNELISKIKNILGDKGYIKYSGNIERSRFIQDFNKYLFNNNFKSILPINIQAQTKTDSFIVLSNGVKNILFYVVLMMFLSESVENFLKDTSSFSLPVPFGNGPWICKNPVCAGMNQAVIKKCVRVDRGGKYISGLFCCPLCGYSFAKRWKFGDQNDAKPYSVLTMGHLYHSALLGLHNSGLNNNQIAKRLNTSCGQIHKALTRIKEPSTDTRIRQSLSMLDTIGDSNAEIAATSEVVKQFDENRKRIMSVLNDHTGITRSQVAKKHSHLYSKMLKYDREWMEKVLPPSEKGKSRVDWNKLDKGYCKLIFQASDALYNSNPTEQIKKHTILARLPRSIKAQLERSPEKLPHTEKLLLNKVESDEHYLIRHIPVIVNQMYKYSKQTITLDRIKSFSPMYRKCSLEMDGKLIEELEKCNYNSN